MMDLQLLESARSGDEEALTALLRHSQADLRRYASLHCAAGDIDDAVQDALWIVHRRYKALRYAAAFSSWMFRMVQRICWRLGRKDRDLVFDGVVERVQARSLEIDLRIDLQRAVLHLDPGQRYVLMLRDVLGHTSEEVADRLNLSTQAVKSKLHRARENVRLELKAGGKKINVKA